MTLAVDTETAYLLDYLLGFGRLLRQMGVAVDPGKMIESAPGCPIYRHWARDGSTQRLPGRADPAP